LPLNVIKLFLGFSGIKPTLPIPDPEVLGEFEFGASDSKVGAEKYM
jgi:hypothetical protein